MNKNPFSLISTIALLLCATAPAALAQVEVTEPAGSDYRYIYNPLEAEEFPAEAIDTGDPQLVYLFEEEHNTAYLHAAPGMERSVTWHFQLTSPGAVWSADARVRADVMMIAEALEDRESHYWLMEFSTDGFAFTPFFSTRASDSSEPYFWPGGSHSSTGPFFLDRGGFEGGVSDVYIRVTAVHESTVDGNQMQAFRTDTNNNRQFEFIASVEDQEDAGAVTITTQEAVEPLAQASDDDLNGNVGEMSAPFHSSSAGGAEALTDATSSTDPQGNVFWYPDSGPYHITWDLGSDIEPANRQLDEISVWIDAHDNGRRGYRGAFYTSMDGEEFQLVDGTAYGDRLGVGGSGASPLFNKVQYSFSEGQVVGFRYLRFVSYGREISATYLAQTRFVEIDASFSVAEGPVGFSAWQEAHFSPEELEDESISGPSADPVGDGIPNLLRYALGAEPRTPDPAALPSTAVEDDYLTLTFAAPADLTGVVSEVQTSGELAGWESNAVLLRDEPGTDGETIYTYRDSVPMTGNNRRFMRLKVTQD